MEKVTKHGNGKSRDQRKLTCDAFFTAIAEEPEPVEEPKKTAQELQLAKVLRFSTGFFENYTPLSKIERVHLKVVRQVIPEEIIPEETFNCKLTHN